LIVFGKVAAQFDCKQFCHENALCSTACGQNTTVPTQLYFTLAHAYTFDEATTITGSDNPATPVNRRMVYFTTLDGRIYRYSAMSNVMRLMHTIPATQLSRDNGRGLYDIAFHRDFQRTRLAYLHYSAHSEDANHDNVIAEYSVTGTGFFFEREVARFPQYTAARSGGWMKMGLKDSFFAGTAWLYVALGGNTDESVRAHESASTIFALPDPDSHAGNSKPSAWASGIREPIDCDATIFKYDRVYCLIRERNGTVALQVLRKGYNYGSENYVKQCVGKHCQQKGPRIASTEPILKFAATACPVSSVQLYTGHRMRDFKDDIFLSQDACYDDVQRRFNSTRVLRVYRDHYELRHDSIAMPTDFANHQLINTTFVGADKQDDLLLFGYSLTSKQYMLFQLQPHDGVGVL
jgi:hypothetical protein